MFRDRAQRFRKKDLFTSDEKIGQTIVVDQWVISNVVYGERIFFINDNYYHHCSINYIFASYAGILLSVAAPSSILGIYKAQKRFRHRPTGG